MTAALEDGEWSAARPGRTLPRERLGTHFTGGWVEFRAGLDGRKIPFSRDSMPGPSSPPSVAIPTELPCTKVNNNNIYLLQLGCYPVAVVILHVNKTRNWLLINLSPEGYMRSM